MADNYMLANKVIRKSESDNWNEAVLEWEIEDVEEDSSLSSMCICGKEGLKYLYTIQNVNNGNVLNPIGSRCIKKFKRTELDDYISVSERMFRLLHAMEERKFIELNSEFFSRKLLSYLFEEEVFKESPYGTAEESYEFMLDMFNKRNDPTAGQERKIKAIIMNDIRPYLRERLEDKVKR